MVRVGGLSYRIDISQPIGRRISEMQLARTGALIDPARSYRVAGWASINEATQGPPVYEVVGKYIQRQRSIPLPRPPDITVTGMAADAGSR